MTSIEWVVVALLLWVAAILLFIMAWDRWCSKQRRQEAQMRLALRMRLAQREREDAEALERERRG